MCPLQLRLDHGDLLVMDGLAQSENVHCTVPELQGLRVNLTYRWVTQHTASCPLAGVVGCVLPNVCARFSRAKFPVGWEKGKINSPLLVDWSSFCQSWSSVLLVSTWIHIRRGLRHSGQRPSRPAVYLPSRDRARWVGGAAFATVTTSPIF